MRVPYAPSTPPTPADEPIYTRIAARRAPRPLIPLDLALLHNPAVADGWNAFLGAVRTQTSVPAALRELAIARVAVLNRAVHEWDVHAALALAAGVERGVLRVCLALGRGAEGDGTRKGEGEGGNDDGPRDEDGKMDGLTEEQWAVLRYTDQMTIGVEVEDAVAESLKRFLNDKQVVELTATVAAYNCVSRFLVALDVGECNGRPMKGVEEL